MMMTFRQSVQFLETLIPHGKTKKFPGEIGFVRQKKLLALVGNPQQSFSAIHITGTSGKGSTAYLASKILHEAGYKVGLHVSPHLLSIRERIQIGMEPVSEETFAELASVVYPAIYDFSHDPEMGSPTYFEAIVAMTFLAFARAHVDIAVVEVGLGGKYDGTNTLGTTKVAVVTNVGLDHTEILGDTVEKIAEDKKEIIKSGCIVITGAKQESVREILRKKCHDVGAPLMILGCDIRIHNRSINANGVTFDYAYKNIKYPSLFCSLLGEYQAGNAALAVTAVLSLCPKKFPVSEIVIRQALLASSNPGRMQVVSRHPWVVFDGAHNGDKMRALVSSFPRIFSYRELIVVFALKKDKDVASITKLLTGITQKMVVTEFIRGSDMGSHICRDAEELAGMIRENAPETDVTVVRDSVKAFAYAKRIAREDDAILVTGSLYLVGELLGSCDGTGAPFLLYATG